MRQLTSREEATLSAAIYTAIEEWRKVAADTSMPDRLREGFKAQAVMLMDVKEALEMD